MELELSSRYSSLMNNFHEYSFHILGCGAIGSSAAMQLARSGATTFFLYDMDKVEELNIGVSQYDIRHVGIQKVKAFDTMNVRMEAVKILCANKQKPMCIIDGRMGAEHYQQYIIPKPDIDKYEKIWYSDDDMSTDPCNAKATSYCSNMSGSFIANAVRKFVTGQPFNGNFSFNFPTMMMNKL